MTPDASALLRWYDTHRRILPWRSLPGQRPDPYAVWLSEIMLQQTTVKAVIDYYNRFLTHYPTVQGLANAPLEDVLHLWAGLGYYARARNLHACARRASELGGFPETVDALLTLPGIGAYTARAIAAIAFGQPVVPVDGNVERVTARLYAMEDPLPASRSRIAQQAAHLNADAEAQARPSDFAQALFDLGATICTPRAPSCLTCPWRTSCIGQSRGIAASLPVKAPKQARPVRYGAHFVLRDGKGNVLLRQRPPKGLLGGMDECPGTEWRSTRWAEEDALSHAPFLTQWQDRGTVTHVFTHFTLHLTVYEATLPAGHNAGINQSFGTFRPAERAALSGVMKKCLLRADQDVETT
ncbi:A/G-specific adenine glycosylase [Gluconobacter morbifer]|uniref:Adenine DNA glycosylase n=1 Tax=Gluconobacter morbifer G707 TaxID=1088869 RepID=G6XKF5_9PROT|nr:A/G-specific adenine glycosylase [Gluconobacter morbifer]EHH67751.1 A/G-specific adenine DNA glycosylase [Gluconobacter morbifer G707]